MGSLNFPGSQDLQSCQDQPMGCPRALLSHPPWRGCCPGRVSPGAAAAVPQLCPRCRRWLCLQLPPAISAGLGFPQPHDSAHSCAGRSRSERPQPRSCPCPSRCRWAGAAAPHQERAGSHRGRCWGRAALPGLTPGGSKGVLPLAWEFFVAFWGFFLQLLVLL